MGFYDLVISYYIPYIKRLKYLVFHILSELHYAAILMNDIRETQDIYRLRWLPLLPLANHKRAVSQ